MHSKSTRYNIIDLQKIIVSANDIFVRRDYLRKCL